MENYKYYGLVLTEESKERLRSLLRDCVLKPESVSEVHLDHCVLLRAEHEQDNVSLKQILDSMIMSDVYITIDAVGCNSKALLLKVEGVKMICAYDNPHILACTFKGKIPSVVEWMDLTPMTISTKLIKV